MLFMRAQFLTRNRERAMKTKLYTHKRKSGRYRINFIAKGSGTLNTTGNDELAVYHNELGQHFVRPLAEFHEVMNEVIPRKVAIVGAGVMHPDEWKGNWPASAEKRAAQIMQNGNGGEPYQAHEAEE